MAKAMINTLYGRDVLSDRITAVRIAMLPKLPTVNKTQFTPDIVDVNQSGRLHSVSSREVLKVWLTYMAVKLGEVLFGP